MKKDCIVAALLLFIVSNIVFLNDLPSLDYFHRDEVNWINVSIFSFNTFFIEKDFQNEGWNNSFRTFGFQNPQVGKFIIGSSLYLHKYREFEGVIAWEADKTLAWHIDEGIVPTRRERFAARLPIILFASGTVSLVGLLAMLTLDHLITGRLLIVFGGIVAALLFMAHPVIWTHSHRAMPDIPAIFFSTLAVFLIIITVLTYQKALFKQGFLLGVVAALSLGLAISTKMNALLAWGIVLLVLVVSLISYLGIFKTWKSPAFKCFAVTFVLQLIIPPIIFFGLNPFLYKSGMANLEKMMRFSSQIANRRAHLPNVALYTLLEKTKAFVNLAFGSSTAIYILIFVFGLVVIGHALLKLKFAKMEATLTFLGVLIWVFVMGFGVLLWTPLAWGRYYIPWVPAASVIQAVGVTYLLFALLEKILGNSISGASQ